MGHPDPLVNHPLSHLESLPVEIIQSIFLHSLEINLPRASPHLSRALSNPLIYTWLIRLVFSSANPGSREGIFTRDFLPPPLDFWSLSSQHRQHLQTTILECRWCTLPLLRKCQREYVEHVILRKCAGLVFDPEDQALLSNLGPRFETLEDCDQATDGRRGKGDLVISSKLAENLRDSTSRDIDRKVAIWFHFGAVQIRHPNEVYYENDLFRLPSSETMASGRIPDKLLRSPWSDTQFEFLQLLSKDFYLDEHDFKDRSGLITLRLIRNRRIEPLRRLLGMLFRTADCRVPSPWPVHSSHCVHIRRYGVGPGDPFALLVLNERWDYLPAPVKLELERYVRFTPVNIESESS